MTDMPDEFIRQIEEARRMDEQAKRIKSEASGECERQLARSNVRVPITAAFEPDFAGLRLMQEAAREAREEKASHLASGFHKRLIKWIQDFNATLDNAHEVGVRLVSFGQTVVFNLTDIGYWNPSLIIFKGVTPEGEPVELIQHTSQISILLMKMARQKPEEPKKPIGFHGELDETEGNGNGQSHA